MLCALEAENRRNQEKLEELQHSIGAEDNHQLQSREVERAWKNLNADIAPVVPPGTILQTREQVEEFRETLRARCSRERAKVSCPGAYQIQTTTHSKHFGTRPARHQAASPALVPPADAQEIHTAEVKVKEELAHQVQVREDIKEGRLYLQVTAKALLCPSVNHIPALLTPTTFPAQEIQAKGPDPRLRVLTPECLRVVICTYNSHLRRRSPT